MNKPEKSQNTQPKNSRIQSIDILRGLVMVLMAIDHVRVYSGIPASGADAGVFLTRWITHFCAPAFVFFAGTSIFLMSLRSSKGKLSRQLIIRGLMLVVLEMTLLKFFWTFNLSYDFVLAGVIWMLGWCMVIMAAFVWLKPKTVCVFGILIVLFQQVFAQIPKLLPGGLNSNFLTFWKFIYPTGFENPREDTVVVLYVIVPWIGVMALGYAFGRIFGFSPERRRKICVLIGVSMVALFLLFGSYEILYGPSQNEAQPFIFRLLNQAKYPASHLFLLMTLGPLILLIPFLERPKKRLFNIFRDIGRVPLFFYTLHILLIHVSALLVQYVISGAMHQKWFSYAPFTSVPPEHRWSLPLLYLVFAVDVTILYFVCKWYARFKANHPEKKWLRYF